MRQGYGSQGGWALRALAVTHPSPGSMGATGERRGPLPFHAVVRTGSDPGPP